MSVLTHILAQAGGPQLQQYIHLFVVVLIMLSSVFGWLFKRMKEQREKREADALRRRLQEETLRTGRPMSASMSAPPTASPSSTLQPSIEDEAKRKLAELAARRRRELAEMMKQSGGGGGGAGSGAGTPAAPAGTPGSSWSARPANTASAPTSRTAPPTAQPMNRPKPADRLGKALRPQSIEQQQRTQRERVANDKADRDAAVRQGAKQQELARRQKEEARERAERERERREADEVPHMRRDAVDPSQAETPAMARMAAAAKAAAGISAGSDWRRAIVMAELLNRPLAMREPDERML
ncbi:MAG: hypothetical protein K2W85_06130 [Phycisphaerales bacterium]|nr:hypothetical protein [Phycisphaerales bacterium]